MWISLILLSLSFPCNIVESGVRVELVDTFSTCISEERGLPCGWYATKKDISMISLLREGSNTYLKIKTVGGCTAIGIQKQYDCKEFPELIWKWRVYSVPSGALENVRKLADSAAGVYVIFKGKLRLNRIIKYVWSSSLEKGVCVESPYNERVKIVVLQSGDAASGIWISECVNVVNDYKRLFGREPSDPVVGIAILSDSDNTRSMVDADYDDFWIRGSR